MRSGRANRRFSEERPYPSTALAELLLLSSNFDAACEELKRLNVRIVNLPFENQGNRLRLVQMAQSLA
ncbi:MAG: hypothetical protein ABSC08_02270 [Bryobacteraceae bacterium]|jgi:hypothetical protein